MSDHADNPTRTANEIIAETREQGCMDRGEGRGKCHVFVDYEDCCQCGERRLTKGRELK